MINKDLIKGLLDQPFDWEVWIQIKTPEGRLISVPVVSYGISTKGVHITGDWQCHTVRASSLCRSNDSRWRND